MFFIETAVLKLAMQWSLTTSAVQHCFQRTGLYPLNKDAIDRTALMCDVTTIIPDETPCEIPLLMECDDQGIVYRYIITRLFASKNV